MSETSPQTAANHGRMDPWFHYVLVPVVLVCVLFCVYFAVHRPSPSRICLAVLSLAVLLLAFKTRVYGLKVQDRVIRLEERLRLAALLPEPLRLRIPELSERQLIALRFAADEEVPSLVARTLQEGLDPKAIKQAIQHWRPDHWRV